MRVFLTGFMASGKTTVGISLAAHLGIPFVDLDRLIESRENSSISEIFAEVGEEGFRYIEQAHLHSLRSFKNVVIATGGGAACFGDNMPWMNRFGTTVYLNVPEAVLIQRLENETQKRPLLAALDKSELNIFIQKMLEQRRPFYEKSHITISGDLPFAKLIETASEKIREHRREVFLAWNEVLEVIPNS